MEPTSRTRYVVVMLSDTYSKKSCDVFINFALNINICFMRKSFHLGNSNIQTQESK